MNSVDKKYVILGSLCALVLMLVVGYAAFSAVLNIKGTTNISSSWDVKITGIEKIASKGSTDKAGTPKFDDLSATFDTEFTTPGDYATYKIEITNGGDLDAKLTKMDMPANTNKDIEFYLNKNVNNEEYTDALKQNDTLFKKGGTGNVGYVYVTVLYRDYENQQTATTKTQSMTITFDFEQAEGNGGIVSETAADKLIAIATEEDGLYVDEYETGRYVYKGANPNNYITFNNETWRIISAETDGTLKIMKKDSIGNKVWDTTGGTYGSNNWARPADLNTYLNNETEGAESYYNTLSNEAKGLIEEHVWGIGPVTYDNTDLAVQIISENGTTWSGNIGLMSVSDYLRANTNTEQCGNFSLNNTNYSTCQTTNYIVQTSGWLWTISPTASVTYFVFIVNSNGNVSNSIANFSSGGVLPVLYLTSNITLSGEGTSSSPYTIVSQ